MSEPTTPAGPRRAALAFIFVTVVLDVLAFGVILPVLPRLIEHFLTGDTARAAQIYGFFGFVWALMQFFCSPILGALSDRFGRRKVILASNFGLGLDYVFMALAPTLPWLLVGRIISGVTGASFVTAYAYIADVTPPEKRASSFGMVGAAFGLGFVLGPAMGGLLGGIDLRLPFWVAAGLTLLNACYGLFVLPESLAPERRQAFSWRRANPVGSLRLLRSRPSLLGMASVYFLYHLAHHSLASIFVLYATFRYAWGERAVGLTLGAVGVLSVLVQGGLVRPFVKRFGERVALLTGLFFGSLGFVLYGLAPTGWLFLWAMPVFALMGLFNPSFQGLVTRKVGASEQGQLQGANSSVMGLTGLVGPVLFTQTFAYFIGTGSGWHLPGAPYLLAALLLLIGMGVAWRTTAGERTAPPSASG